jgi:hypothetical protein
VDDPSDTAFIDIVDAAMSAYEYAPARELILTTSSEVLQAIKGLKAGKVPGPKAIPNGVLTHLPKRTITFLTKMFNGILCKKYFQPVWKHARVVPTLKPRKDPTLPSSYILVSLLDTVGKLFEKIRLSRVLREINESGLLRKEHMGIDPSTTRHCSWPALLKEATETLTRGGLTGAVFLDVAKAFDTVWVKGPLYKLTALNFSSYLVKTVSSYLDGRTFQTSFESATSRSHVMRAGVAQGGLVSPALFSLYVNDIPTPSRHVELAQYADDTGLIATSRDPSLLVGYLEACLSRLELWLRNWRIAINVSKNMAVLFARPRDASDSPGQCSFSESQQSGSKQPAI